MKRLLTFASMTLLSCGIGIGATFGPQGMASTPDAEFVTLSDMASMPIAATAGDALAPAQAATVPATAPQAFIVEPAAVVLSVETVTNTVGVTGMTTGALDSVKPNVGETALSNGVIAVDTTTELMSVASFTSASEKQNLISIALDDVPLQDVVRLFTRISGANIISSSTNLHGKVSVNLQDVEWKPALDSILDMHSLMVTEKVPGSGIYSVMTKVAGAEPLIAQPIFLNYAQVSNVVMVVQTMIGKGGSVSPFPNANALIVRASAADLSSIIKVVTEIDVPRQQVYIEVKILELSDEAIKDLGVNWKVLGGVDGKPGGYELGLGGLSRTLNDSITKVNGNKSGSVQTDFRKSSDAIASGNSVDLTTHTTVGTLGQEIPTTTSHDTSDSIAKSMNYTKDLTQNRDQTLTDVRTAVLSAKDFSVVLSALEQINGITVVSNPKIIVANQETATIHIGQNQPNIRGTVTPGQQGQQNSTTYALDAIKPYFEFGISLEVTPTINNQSNISVRISPTLSRYVKDLEAPDTTLYPIEATKKIKTVFSLESGKTAAIGGLTETDDRDNVVKIPLLGDIPLIGKYLFTYTHKKHTQTETIIFVTVALANSRAIQSEEGLPEDTVLAQNQMIVSKKLRDQRKADAVIAAEKEKAATLKVASKAKADSAKGEPTP